MNYSTGLLALLRKKYKPNFKLIKIMPIDPITLI